MDIYSMVMDRKAQYCYNISSSQLDLKVWLNPNKNPIKLLCGYQETVFNVDMERKKTNPSQHNWSLTVEQRQYNEEKVDFSINDARTTGLPHAKKKKIETSFTIITSLNSKV